MSQAAPLSLAVARAARRRAMVADGVRIAPWYLTGAAVAAGCVVAYVRYFQLPLRWETITFGGAALAVAGIALHAALNRWTLPHAASEVDRTLGLKDQLGTAIELANGTKNDPGFAWLAITAGEMAAARVNVAHAVKITWHGGWWVGAAASIGLAASSWFYMPAPMPPRVTEAQAKTALDQARQVARVADETKLAPMPPPELSELDQIEKELEQGKATPTDAATRAANILERAAAERSKEARAAQAQTEDVREKLARAANSAKPSIEGQTPADTSAIRKALQSGDLDKASEEAQKLAENAERLTSQERSIIERDLRDLADALDRQAREAAETKALRSAEERRDKAETRQSVSEENRDKQEAGQTATSPDTDTTTPPEPARSAEQQTGKLADAARRAADELKQPERPSGKQADSQSKASENEREERSQKSQGDSPASERMSDSEKGEQKPADKGNSTKPGGEKSQSVQPQPSSDRKSAPAGEKSGDPSKQIQGKSADGTKTTPSSEEKQQGQADGQPQSQSEKGDASPGNDDGASKQTQEKKPAGESARGEKAGDSSKPETQKYEQRPGTQPGDGNAAKEGGTDPQNSSGLQKLARELKQMQNAAKDAAKNEQSSEKMQEQARRILKDMDPAQRKELEKLAQGGGGGQGQGSGAGDAPQSTGGSEQGKPWSGASKIVDFRTKPGDAAGSGKERVISDWQKQTPDGQRAPRESGAAMEEDIRQAREGAERAIEQQSVPAQHRDLVRRVFERFNDRAKPGYVPAAPVTAPPAPDAKPAAGSGGR